MTQSARKTGSLIQGRKPIEKLGNHSEGGLSENDILDNYPQIDGQPTEPQNHKCVRPSHAIAEVVFVSAGVLLILDSRFFGAR